MVIYGTNEKHNLLLRLIATACKPQLIIISFSTDMILGDEVELRVTSNAHSNHDWVEVSHEELLELSLTCTAHDARTGAPLAKDLPVFWSKVSVGSE